MGVDLNDLDVDLSTFKETQKSNTKHITGNEDEEDVDARLIEAHIALNEGHVTQYENLAHSKESSFHTSTRNKEKIKQYIEKDMVSDSEIGQVAGFKDNIKPLDDKFDEEFNAV